MNAKKDDPALPESSTSPAAAPSIKNFVVKTLVVVFAIAAALSWIADSVLPDAGQMAKGIKQAFADRNTRLRFNGMLSSNPRVNWEVSLDMERQGKLSEAYEEMVVAVGILERQNVRADFLAPYTERLSNLRNKVGNKEKENSKDN